MEDTSWSMHINSSKAHINELITYSTMTMAKKKKKINTEWSCKFIT